MHKIVNFGSDLFILKRKFKVSDVKDENLLADIKWWWGADTLIKTQGDNAYYLLVQRIDDAQILEESEISD